MFGEDGPTDRIAAALVVSAVCVLLAGVVVGLALPATTVSGLEETDPVGINLTGTDPSTLEAEGDLSDFERRLARRIQRQVEAGAINLSEGDFAAVRERINSTEYENLLESYRSVASETGNATQARALARLQRSLANYTAIAERYRTVYAEYQQARESTGEGVDEARAIARDLERIYLAARSAGNRTIERFEALDRRTQLNVSTSASAIRATLRNISATQASVRNDSFVETLLFVSADSRTVAFDDPLVVSGTLRTSNGSAVANRSIIFRVGNSTTAVRTDATGGFELTYRPVRLHTNATELSVRFVPADASPYLGAEQRLPVRVRQVRPTLTVSAPSAVGYNDTLRVTGRVSADDTGAGGVPVVVTLGGRTLNRTTTNGSGVYAVETRLAADVPPGERRIDVRIPLDRRALASATASARVTVRERSTRLSVASERVRDRLVRLTGRLSTDGGVGIPNRTVAVGVGNSTLTTVQTGPGGRINTTLVIPRAAGGEVTLSARFAETGLNVRPATATTTVRVGATGLPLGLLGAGVVLAVLVAGAVAALVRRRRSDAGEDVDPDVETPDRPGESDGRDPGPLLALARSRLEAGESDEAVRAAYAAVRVAMDGTDGATHWEFYRTHAENGLGPETVEALRDLTTAYERATYAAESVSESESQRVVDAAASIAETPA